jgi:hypothetical protein
MVSFKLRVAFNFNAGCWLAATFVGCALHAILKQHERREVFSSHLDDGVHSPAVTLAPFYEQLSKAHQYVCSIYIFSILLAEPNIQNKFTAISEIVFSFCRF